MTFECENMIKSFSFTYFCFNYKKLSDSIGSNDKEYNKRHELNIIQFLKLYNKYAILKNHILENRSITYG